MSGLLKARKASPPSAFRNTARSSHQMASTMPPSARRAQRGRIRPNWAGARTARTSDQRLYTLHARLRLHRSPVSADGDPPFAPARLAYLVEVCRLGLLDPESAVSAIAREHAR